MYGFVDVWCASSHAKPQSCDPSCCKIPIMKTGKTISRTKKPGMSTKIIAHPRRKNAKQLRAPRVFVDGDRYWVAYRLPAKSVSLPTEDATGYKTSDAHL